LRSRTVMSAVPKDVIPQAQAPMLALRRNRFTVRRRQTA
jgi:hypothetical protein